MMMPTSWAFRWSPVALAAAVLRRFNGTPAVSLVRRLLRLLLSSALRKKGYAVEVAYTGPEGLQVARQWRPDVVLLDIGLPGLDGYDVARRLRTLPLGEVDGGETFQGRIIAVTGYGRGIDIARAGEAGFDAHLVKPFAFDELEKLMSSVRSLASFDSVRSGWLAND